MPVSKQEQQIYDVIKNNYCNPILQSYRPDILKNTKTGKNLEIDIYLPVHYIGFEFQGAVHFKEIDRYKNNPDKSRMNDTKKHELLEQYIHNKVCIVEIFEADLKGDILNNIMIRVLNTQEYHFKKRQFKKCLQLEKVYLIFSKVGLKGGLSGSVNFFEHCCNVFAYKRNGLKGNLRVTLFQMATLCSTHTFYNPLRHQINFTSFTKLMHIDLVANAILKEKNITLK